MEAGMSGAGLLTIAALALVCLGLGALLFVAYRRARELETARDEERNERMKAEKALAEERGSAAARQTVMAELDSHLRATFPEVAGQVLERNSKAFLNLAVENLGKVTKQAKSDLLQREQAVESLVKPIRESLLQMNKYVQDVEKTRAEAYGGLTKQVQALAESQQQLEIATSDLVKVLRQPHQRGRWGEVQLDNVLQAAGLMAGLDYVKQATATAAETRLRPDVVVNLPDGGHLVIDAKAPVDAFLNAYEAKTDTDRDEYLRDHVRLLKQHIGTLSGKDYQSQFNPSPDWVVMFVPVESFLTLAMVHDPNLIVESARQRILLTSPTTLIALLTTVATLWKQRRMEERVEEVGKAGAELHDRLVPLAEHLIKVGEDIGRATKSYNAAVGSLEGSVLPSARRMKELGSPVKKELPAVEPVDGSVREIQAPELRRNLKE
jgi:DNA recombination protein RmuC